MFYPRVILHPTDFSECSNAALHIAADLARQNEATLLVLHVAETLGAENVTYGEAASHLEPESYRQRLEEDLRRSVPAPAGVSTKYLLAAGEPAQEISRVAREQSCDRELEQRRVLHRRPRREPKRRRHHREPSADPPREAVDRRPGGRRLTA